MPASSCQIFALLLLLSACHLSGHSTFEKKIPNGDKIPHPCKPNTIWQGVGHLNPAGGGKLNPFGGAFANAGFTWTNELCKADSDQDGKTNGEELGKAPVTNMFERQIKGIHTSLGIYGLMA